MSLKKITPASLIFFRMFFLSLVFSFHFYSIAVNSSSGSDVFIQFVEEQLKNPEYSSEFKNKFNEKWEKSVFKNTQYWSKKDAENLIDFLRNKIGDKDILERMQSLSYLKGLHYNAFVERVLFYEKYMGKEGVAYRLRRSLGGFHRGNVKDIKEVIEIIESYIGRKGMEERMKIDLRGFSVAPDQLEKVIEIIERYIGRKGVEERMKIDFQGFSVEPTRLRDVIKIIESYIGRDGVKERMKANLQGFSVEPTRLRDVIKIIESYIGEEGVKERLRADFQGFNVAPSRLEKVIEIIESYIEREGAEERMKADLQGFSTIDLEYLKQLEQKWGKEKLKNRLKKYNLQNPMFKPGSCSPVFS